MTMIVEHMAAKRLKDLGRFKITAKKDVHKDQHWSIAVENGGKPNERKAYYCEHCKFWIIGEPKAQHCDLRFDRTCHRCTICNNLL